MAEERKQTISVDGKEYDAASLSDMAKRMIANIQFSEQELNRARMMQAAMQSARQSYVEALKKELDGDSTEAAAE